jgi:hypothetical protein
MNAERRTQCGLKGSLCQGDNEQPLFTATTTMNDTDRRFQFFDGRTGLWELGVGVEYPQEVTCPVGGMVVFHYPVGGHNIVMVDLAQDYEDCRLDNATTLSPPTLSTSTTTTTTTTMFPSVSYYHPCTTPGSIDYLACSVPGHCQVGQKIAIYTSAIEYAYNKTNPSEWVVHVRSMARILTLLGYRHNEEVDGHHHGELYIMDRGFQTETLANATVELIWCALDHCPMAAQDVVPSATQDDCKSMIYTLLGFVQRKRPIPQWDAALDYYEKAIELKGQNECAAHSYLTQLYLSNDNFTGAEKQIETLCSRCHEERPLMIEQAKLEYDRLELSADDLDWNEHCIMKSPSAYSSSGVVGNTRALYIHFGMLALTMFRFRWR